MKIKSALLTIILIATCALMAACSQVEFEIKFFVDGEEYSNVTTNGDMIKMPKNPQKEDFIFDGWFWDEGTWQKPFSINSILDAPLSEYLSVFAKWKKSGVLESNENDTKINDVLDEPVVIDEPIDDNNGGGSESGNVTAAQIIGEAIKDGIIVAKGPSGDFIVKVEETDLLATISRIAKDSMFVSIGPFSYIEKGYVLINVVPQYNEFRVLDVDIKSFNGQYYSIALGIPSDYQIPDFSDNVNGGTDNRTAMMFFGIEPVGYEYSPYSGGILYHWTWQERNVLQQLCSVLQSQGYILIDIVEINSAMAWKGTRVEMNTINMGFYHFEYFDGKGNMIVYRYAK